MSAEPTGADVLDAALRAHGMTQAELSRAAVVSQKHLSFVLTGRARLSPLLAARCARALADPDLADRILVAQAHVDAALALALLRDAP